MTNSNIAIIIESIIDGSNVHTDAVCAQMRELFRTGEFDDMPYGEMIFNVLKMQNLA